MGHQLGFPSSHGGAGVGWNVGAAAVGGSEPAWPQLESMLVLILSIARGWNAMMMFLLPPQLHSTSVASETDR